MAPGVAWLLMAKVKLAASTGVEVDTVSHVLASERTGPSGDACLRPREAA